MNTEIMERLQILFDLGLDFNIVCLPLSIAKQKNRKIHPDDYSNAFLLCNLRCGVNLTTFWIIWLLSRILENLEKIVAVIFLFFKGEHILVFRCVDE